jgi:hypothetical protein
VRRLTQAQQVRTTLSPVFESLRASRWTWRWSSVGNTAQAALVPRPITRFIICFLGTKLSDEVFGRAQWGRTICAGERGHMVSPLIWFQTQQSPDQTTEASRWCRERDLNTRPADYESAALPTELPRRRAALNGHQGKAQTEILPLYPRDNLGTSKHPPLGLAAIRDNTGPATGRPTCFG